MDNTHVKRLYALVAVLSPLLSMTLSAKCGGVVTAGVRTHSP
jgi:hypothetical protein